MAPNQPRALIDDQTLLAANGATGLAMTLGLRNRHWRSRLTTCGLLALLLAGITGWAETVASPLPDWVVAGFVAALRDPDDGVVRAAAEYPGAKELLATEPELDPVTVSHLSAVWVQDLEAASGNIPLLAAHPMLARATHDQVAEILGAHSDKARLAGVEFFMRRPDLARPHAAALTARLGDANSNVRAAALKLLRKHPELVNLATIANLLTTADETTTMDVFRAINRVAEQELPTLMPFIETGYTSRRHLPMLRFAAHLLGSGSDQVESILL